MKYLWIDEYLLSLRGVTKDLQPEWNWVRYFIGGKMFAALCRDDADRPIYITLKLEPTEGEFWRGQYPDIIPGYYMNKLHWNSVKADGAVPEDTVKTLLEHASAWYSVPSRRRNSGRPWAFPSAGRTALPAPSAGPPAPAATKPAGRCSTRQPGKPVPFTPAAPGNTASPPARTAGHCPAGSGCPPGIRP